jgi:hypothetical protein
VADSPIGAGTVLAGRFMLEDLLDETDGARFWRATDQTLARNVAVHVLPDSDARADALLTAARTSALVTDGHLLRVLDAANEDGVVYVVNEWSSGISLDRLLGDGPLSPRRAAWVVKEVAEAISTAHRNGIAHGRLLPETVMINEAGSVKLVGFVVDAVLRGRHQRLVTGGDPITAHEADVVNLAGLLYAALVGRWPGTEGTSIPTAPTEHGRPLRPRQVRAGVPRPLDAICDRVLNSDAHAGSVPILTAHEIYAALSDYIGDPTGAPPSDLTPTGVLDTGALTALAADPGEPTQRGNGGPSAADRPDHTDTGDLPATGAMPLPPAAAVPDAGEDRSDEADVERTGDLEATQAGVPMFFDEDSGVGWLRPAQSRGLRRDELDVSPDGPDGPDGPEGPEGPEGTAGTDSGSPRRQASPPPELPPHPERPLFGDGPSAAAAAAARGAGRRETRDDPDNPDNPDGTLSPGSFLGGFTGTHDDPTGSHRRGGRAAQAVPYAWGPDAGQDDADEYGDYDDYDGDWEERDNGTNWLKLAAAIAGVIVLVVAIIFAFNLGRGPSSSDTQQTGPSSSASKTAPASVAVKVAGVKDFDPEGDPPEENPDLAPLAIDGKPGTAWQTLTYRGNPRLGGLKNGVGLLVDLGKRTKVGSVRLTLLGDGTSLELLAAPAASAPPSDTDGLQKVAEADDAGTKVSLELDKPVTTQWLVVWLTSLPPAPGGFKGQVAEISVRS